MSATSPVWLDSLYADTLAEVIAKTTGIELEVLPMAADGHFGDLIGIMRLEGKNSSTLFVSADEAVMRTLCSYMTGVSKKEVTEAEMEDALCEFVNMTAGNLKVRLGNSEYNFSLSMPFIIRGEKMTLATKNREQIIAVNLGNGELTVRITVIYRKTA